MTDRTEPTSPFAEHTVGLEEAARYLGIGPSTLRKRAAGGALPGYKVGRRWKFLPSEVEKYLRASAPAAMRPIPIALLRSPEQGGSDLAREIHRKRLQLARERAERN